MKLDDAILLSALLVAGIIGIPALSICGVLAVIEFRRWLAERRLKRHKETLWQAAEDAQVAAVQFALRSFQKQVIEDTGPVEIRPIGKPGRTATSKTLAVINNALPVSDDTTEITVIPAKPRRDGAVL